MGVLDALQKDFDYDIVDEFAGHYSLMCDEMESLMLDLEKPELYAERVDELFRIFHNIKSATGFLQLPRIAKTSELVESVLEEARVSVGPATSDFVNWLLGVYDQFMLWRTELEGNAIEFSPIDKKLLHIPQKLTL